ncbi:MULTISPECIES: cation diffusion facilitator family transporter [Ureibacillus]|jgi:cobalt-zinc-cadmium efflux system protein|uniref:Cobalt-zinc-cadmium efflux system protein n=1 Tax=Ureibacillus thermosphaericus TaxID=51173 RepID=A0A840PTH8_URETH|nr:cation diffusion facilitator family transporter [Ureibacillus thermosphaericus]MBB5149190.1 cobalt-zinc-cadmium efflux system protein [Ureibacillus thermosphaericus]NKZ31951.1 cation transporter [Ureibacillus thermosphaericus]
MGHGHNHAHHDHTHGANKKTLTIAFFIIATYMIVEAIGGLLTNSLALLSDAGHMLSDAVSLGVGVLAFKFGEKIADYSRTYGYRRFEILAAVFNGVTLILISIFIVIEAIERFISPPEIASVGMLGIAIVGLAVNVLVAWILMRGGDTHDNLNMRAAFLHVIGDMLGSVAAIVAALSIMFLGWGWMDPVASIIVAIIILNSGYRVTKDAIHVLMEGVPSNVNIDEIISLFSNTPGIIGIHDLHVWSITSGQNALSCHAVVDEHLTLKETQKILRKIEHELLHLGIAHMTVQIEDADHVHEDSVLCKIQGNQHHHHHHHH